jgi:ribose transport system permease protein
MTAPSSNDSPAAVIEEGTGRGPVPAPGAPEEPPRRRRSINLGIDRFSGLYLWALFIIVFSIWVPDLFLTKGTLFSVASTQAITTILALAILIPMVAGAFDLSVGAVANLAAIIAVVLMNEHGFGMWPAALVAVGAGTFIGAVNGFFVVRLHIDSFIVTLAMTSLVTAVQTMLTTQGQPLAPTAAGWSELTQTKVLGFQVIVWYVLVIACIVWWVLQYTPAGRYLYATGGNRDAARLSGVSVDKWTWLALMASGCVASIGGVLFASLTGPSLTFGSGLLLPAFAAAFLGSTQIYPGRFNVWGTVIAVYVLATGIKGLQLVTTSQWLGDFFNGTALLVAVGVAVWRQRRTAGTA